MEMTRVVYVSLHKFLKQYKTFLGIFEPVHIPDCEIYVPVHVFMNRYIIFLGLT
jgi:hypothetical protein